MDRAITYIPMDRSQAMARGETLPERMMGAALFADISGFTSLTEAVARELGPRRGAEELTAQLNRVYDALIGELHRYGGSVIGFSGDAITCWLDGDDGRRAAACGLAMQAVMRHFAEVKTFSGHAASLRLKVAAAVGPVRRFLVGDPDYLVIDTMAGKTLEHMVAAEQLAEQGEVVLHSSAAAALVDQLEVNEWREDETSGERFAVVNRLIGSVAEARWPDLADDLLREDQKRAWLLPPVYQRLHGGRGEFLAELRPAVALFVRFAGLSYDEDPLAPVNLNAFIIEVERILARLEGSLIQLTIGDKGSYLYAAFGAPIAHEDDAVRGAIAALEIRAAASHLAYDLDIQIGITQGRMRTGAYGSVMRRTYGVLGDAVNLSARLMSLARPGQILVHDSVRDGTGDMFLWERLPEMRVKGKAEPVALSLLLGTAHQKRARLQELKYTLPMVGRAEELARISEKISQVLMGKGQIVGFTAEAGVGKSRLAAEVIRMAHERGFEGLGGECQSHGTNTSYQAWQSIWRGFFGVAGNQPLAEQLQTVEQELTRISPSLAARLPLLGAVLNLNIPDTDLTRSFDAKLRKTSLDALLVDCLRARARATPQLLVLEDCHWLDPLSRDLIEVIGRAIANLPVLMLLAYRPLEAQRLREGPVGQLLHFTEFELADFTPEESRRLITFKLGQFLGPGSEVPPDCVAEITRRAAGNPFYIEEILNYLRDMGIDPRDAERLRTLDLPSSIYSLILSRLDQLSERQQITVRVASVIGRLFKAAMIWGVYPELGEMERVRADLERLSALELTAQERPEPELVYFFKHTMTQEVAYESIPYATRAALHEQIGQYLERTHPTALERYLDLLAFHYDRSSNADKRREYLIKAGREAQRNYANAAALDYYRRGLPLLARDQQIPVMLSMGQVLELVGRWEDADDAYQQALALSEELGDLSGQAQACIAIGELRRKRGRYGEATPWYKKGRALSEQQGDQAGVAKVLICAGTLANQQGDPDAAVTLYEQSLAIRRRLDDQPNMANALNNLGVVARSRGDYARARGYQEEALAIRRALRDRWAIAFSLNNLGNVALDEGKYSEARAYLQEAVALQREIGDKWAIGNALNNLGNVTREQGDYATTRALYEESLHLNRELGDRWALAYLLEDIGCLVARQGGTAVALRLIGAASALREAIGAPLSPAEQSKLDASLEPARQALSEAERTAALAEGRIMGLEPAIEQASQLVA